MESMQGNQQDMEVLGGWCAFVEATGLAKSRVSAADIQQEQQIRFSRHTVQEDLTGFSFSLSPHQSADLKQRFVKTGDQGEASSEPLHLGFPLLRIVEKEDVVCPAVPLSVARSLVSRAATGRFGAGKTGRRCHGRHCCVSRIPGYRYSGVGRGAAHDEYRGGLHGRAARELH